MTTLQTARLDLVPMTLAIVEAVIRERRDEVARLANADVPSTWPSRSQVERAYSSIDRIREDPDGWLWGDRLLITREESRRVVGSVVFHGRPGGDGVVEIAYGVEPGSQGKGYASEATRACVDWALAQPGVRAVQAATLSWHRPSVRVLERLGMVVAGSRDHETLGELVIYELRR